jgi:hypothetical protein
MSQTNIKVPIEQRNHDKEVLEKRRVLLGDERFKPPNPPGGPSSLGQDDKLHPVVLHHNSAGGRGESGLDLAIEAPDLLYKEHTTDSGGTVAGMPTLGTHKQHMSGRRYAGEQYNVGRNVGSTHLQLPAEPHGPDHKKEGPHDLGTVLPKDQ